MFYCFSFHVCVFFFSDNPMKNDNNDSHSLIIDVFGDADGDTERILLSCITLSHYRAHSLLQTLAAFNSHTAHVQYNIDRQ